MRDKYPYLSDPRTLEEIRKHKWIESEKKGEDVGFSAAGLDWINRYGREWKKAHRTELLDTYAEGKKEYKFKLSEVLKFLNKDIILPKKT